MTDDAPEDLPFFSGNIVSLPGARGRIQRVFTSLLSGDVSFDDRIIEGSALIFTKPGTIGTVGRWPVQYPGWFQGGFFDTKRPGDDGYEWSWADYTLAASVVQTGGTEATHYLAEIW